MAGPAPTALAVMAAATSNLAGESMVISSGSGCVSNDPRRWLAPEPLDAATARLPVAFGPAIPSEMT